MKKQSVMSIITARATFNFSFFIKMDEANMKGSGYVKRVFEVAGRSDTTPDYKSGASLRVGA